MFTSSDRPTFSSPSKGDAVVIEVHILDYTGDLYGKTLEVRFLETIREEKKFISKEDLKKAIEEDIKRMKRRLKKYLTKKIDFL